MSKIEFCKLLFRYISDDITNVDIESSGFIFNYNFDEDSLFLAKEYFSLTGKELSLFKIYYKDVTSITC